MSIRDYELTTITKEENLPAVEQAITRAGGTITDQRSLGRRAFAYPIQKETAGFYTAYRLTLEPTAVAQLDKEFRLTSDLMRHILVNLPLARLSNTLDSVEELKEAKELNDDANAAKPKVEDAERDKALDEQLHKLLNDETGAGADSSAPAA